MVLLENSFFITVGCNMVACKATLYSQRERHPIADRNGGGKITPNLGQ